MRRVTHADYLRVRDGGPLDIWALETDVRYTGHEEGPYAQ